MVSNLIFIIVLGLAFAFWGLGHVAGAFVSEGCGQDVTEYLSLFHIPESRPPISFQGGPTVSLIFLLSPTYLQKSLLAPAEPGWLTLQQHRVLILYQL